MDTLRQRLETKDLKIWVERTTDLLAKSADLLNDLNTFPVPNFNTGSNLLASWSGIARFSKGLSAGLKPGQYTANLAGVAAKYPRGASGMFLAAFFGAMAKTWRDTAILRPADLVMAAETIETEFRALDGDAGLEYGLSSLASAVNEELSKLELYTLSQVIGTALVGAQERTVDSADANRGVGDAGLAGACLIIASLADVAAEAEGEAPANVELVSAMLSEWADRSRTLTKALRATPPGGEFAVTFRQVGFAADLKKQREALSSTCSEVLLTGSVDEIGFGAFTTHVHTAVPLSALPHPPQGVLLEHLSETGMTFPDSTEEDPLPERGNVVLLSRFTKKPSASPRAHLLVLSEAPALMEMFARGGATVLLEPGEAEQIDWALGTRKGPVVVIPASEATRKLAEQFVESNLSENPERSLVLAPTVDELSAVWLCEELTKVDLRSLPLVPDGGLEREIQRILSEIRVEKMSDHLESQLDGLLAFSGEETKELFAVIGATQANPDRMSLQSLVALDPQIELITYYGGQTGPTLLGIHS